MTKNFSFTSESVSRQHPDKICDFISDSILDEVLTHDKNGKVAVETFATKNRLIIAGEISANAGLNYKNIAKKCIKDLGYTEKKYNFTHNSPIEIHIHEQSPEIARGVKKKGAGDQGMMFGFACKETENLMPLPITLAHELAMELDKIKKTLTYLRPDGKNQVTVEYKDNKPFKVTHAVVAVPHAELITQKQVKRDIYEFVLRPTLEKRGFSLPEKDLVVNGTGVWHIGGPAMDTGLTGRKIVVDTYGGYARVGGGAFSGKDPSKVDRSGAYAARFLAKNIVAYGLCEKAEVTLAYFIGAKKPVMLNIETFGTEKTSIKSIYDFADKFLDTSVEGIIEGLKLRKPIYAKTSSYGHFGRPEFSWEKIV
jgi:S-adenosylmethionine synthetase